MVTQGIYEHYKSTPEDRKLYQVLFLTRDEATLAVLVHYVPLYRTSGGEQFNDGIAGWTRTLENFSEQVTHNGKTMPRFTLVDSIVE
jgi:hypothetical protein